MFTACLSQDKKRNARYHLFLEACRNQQATLNKLVRLGSALMRKEKLYHHFFGDHSLRSVAAHLALFSLKLPYDYSNKAYLSRKIAESEAIEIIKLYEKRIAERMPVAYLTEEAQYLGRAFYVNEQVLVPRSLMNTRFNDFLTRTPWKNYRVLDLCTGSGCIGITLALLDPRLKIDLADLSAQALEVAAINVKRYALGERVTCIQSDLFENIKEKYDLIITNPPYVSDYEYKWQPPEIKKEPALALKGGVEGLDLINRILLQAKDHLNPQGLLVAELGYGVTKLLKQRYPAVPFEGFCAKPPLDKKRIGSNLFRWFDLPFEWSGYLDGVILCERANLPSQLAHKSQRLKSIFYRSYRFMRSCFILAQSLKGTPKK